MTTRKHKPTPATAKKRPAQASKPVKTVAAEKTVAVASVARDKDRSKPAAAPKKAAAEVTHHHAQGKPVDIKPAAPADAVQPSPEPKTAAPAVDGKNSATKAAADKKVPLGIERRV